MALLSTIDNVTPDSCPSPNAVPCGTLIVTLVPLHFPTMSCVYAAFVLMLPCGKPFRSYFIVELTHLIYVYSLAHTGTLFAHMCIFYSHGFRSRFSRPCHGATDSMLLHVRAAPRGGLLQVCSTVFFVVSCMLSHVIAHSQLLSCRAVPRSCLLCSGGPGSFSLFLGGNVSKGNASCHS